MKALKILGIETQLGVFIQSAEDRNLPYSCSSLAPLLFDGQLSEPTFNKKWRKIMAPPRLVQKPLPAKNINKRYRIIDPDMVSKALPEVLPYPLPTHIPEELYRYEYDEEAQEAQVVEFEYIKLCEVLNFYDFEGFSYPVNIDRWDPKKVGYITPENVVYPELNSILFPSLLLNQGPQKLSSKQSYDIVRKHVRDNIDPRVAKITSDYDFCFTVQRRVPMSKPLIKNVEIKTPGGRSYRVPKFNTIEVKEKLVPVFEMTHDVDRYKGYTVLEGFYGDNEGDLKNNIDRYLEELMAQINAPWKECECCEGLGYITQ